jgi:uncharacterized protein (TIGR03083 family)
MDALLNELTHNRNQLLALISHLSEDQLEHPNLIGTWSIKNLIAHLAAWESWGTEMLLEALPTGIIPEHLKAAIVVDYDTWNAEQVAERAELSADEQLVELDRVRTALLEVVARLDAKTLAQQVTWNNQPETVADFVRIWADHDLEHLDDLRGAVAQL